MLGAVEGYCCILDVDHRAEDEDFDQGHDELFCCASADAAFCHVVYNYLNTCMICTLGLTPTLLNVLLQTVSALNYC